jgi:Uma2 family endonuclease
MITALKTCKTEQSSLTLEDFLRLPETEPAGEFINGKIESKSMPQGEHSRIQAKLCTVINQITEPQKIACAFSELRCTFGGRSLVPDVAVFQWSRIPLTEKGRIATRFLTYPDWVIEILSPEQSQTKVLDKLLFCSELGTELGWLIDPEEETVLVVFPEQKVKLLREDNLLPVLENIDLKLTVNDVFSWLSFEPKTTELRT